MINCCAARGRVINTRGCPTTGCPVAFTGDNPCLTTVRTKDGLATRVACPGKRTVGGMRTTGWGNLTNEDVGTDGTF